MYSLFKKNKCLVSGCTNKIINAHAISSSISLNTIVEKDKDAYGDEFNHLYYFKPIQKGQQTKIPQISKIGINDATASQCFCKVHDEIFLEIDNNCPSRFIRTLSRKYSDILKVEIF